MVSATQKDNNTAPNQLSVYFPFLKEIAFAPTEISSVEDRDIRSLYETNFFQSFFLPRTAIEKIQYLLKNKIKTLLEEEQHVNINNLILKLDKIRLKNKEKEKALFENLLKNFEHLSFHLNNAKNSESIRKKVLKDLIEPFGACLTGLLNPLIIANHVFESFSTIDGLLAKFRLEKMDDCAAEVKEKYSKSYVKWEGVGHYFSLEDFEIHFKQLFLKYASEEIFSLNLPKTDYLGKNYEDPHEKKLWTFYQKNHNGEKIFLSDKDARKFFYKAFQEKYTPEAIINYIAMSVVEMILGMCTRDKNFYDNKKNLQITSEEWVKINNSILLFNKQTYFWGVFFDIQEGNIVGEEIYTLRTIPEIKKSLFFLLKDDLFNTKGAEFLFLEQAGYFELGELEKIEEIKPELKELFSDPSSLENAYKILQEQASVYEKVIHLKEENYREATISLIKVFSEKSKENTEYLKYYSKKMKKLFPNVDTYKTKIKETLETLNQEEREIFLVQSIKENDEIRANFLMDNLDIVLPYEKIHDLQQNDKLNNTFNLLLKAKKAYYENIFDNFNQNNYLESSSNFFSIEGYSNYLNGYLKKMKQLFPDKELFKEKIHEVFKESLRMENPADCLKNYVENYDEEKAHFLLKFGFVLKPDDFKKLDTRFKSTFKKKFNDSNPEHQRASLFKKVSNYSSYDILIEKINEYSENKNLATLKECLSISLRQDPISRIIAGYIEYKTDGVLNYFFGGISKERCENIVQVLKIAQTARFEQLNHADKKSDYAQQIKFFKTGLFGGSRLVQDLTRGLELTR